MRARARARASAWAPRSAHPCAALLAVFLAAEAARKAAEADLAVKMQAHEATKKALVKSQMARCVAAITAKRERKLKAERAAPKFDVPSVPRVEIAAAV